MTTLRLLYVEDNCELRDAMSLLLESDGREIVSCATAEEALRLDAQAPFDLVISDVSLPGMSGADLARKLLAQDRARWVVLCSGYQLGDDLRALGPNVRSLAKPFEMDALDRLLDEAQTAHQAPTPA
jgi:two-component system, cell cycle response regulator CpdR